MCPDFSGVQEASKRETDSEAEKVKGNCAEEKGEACCPTAHSAHSEVSGLPKGPLHSATAEPGCRDHQCRLLPSPQAGDPPEDPIDPHLLNCPVLGTARETCPFSGLVIQKEKLTIRLT